MAGRRRGRGDDRRRRQRQQDEARRRQAAEKGRRPYPSPENIEKALREIIVAKNYRVEDVDKFVRTVIDHATTGIRTTGRATRFLDQIGRVQGHFMEKIGMDLSRIPFPDITITQELYAKGNKIMLSITLRHNGKILFQESPVSRGR